MSLGGCFFFVVTETDDVSRSNSGNVRLFMVPQFDIVYLNVGFLCIFILTRFYSLPSYIALLQIHGSLLPHMEWAEIKNYLLIKINIYILLLMLYLFGFQIRINIIIAQLYPKSKRKIKKQMSLRKLSHSFLISSITNIIIMCIINIII